MKKLLLTLAFIASGFNLPAKAGDCTTLSAITSTMPADQALVFMRPATRTIYTNEMQKRKMIWVADKVEIAFYTYLPNEDGYVHIYLLDGNKCLLQSGRIRKAVHQEFLNLAMGPSA